MNDDEKQLWITPKVTLQARRKQLESGAAKRKETFKTPQQKGFYFFYFEKI